MSRYLVPLIPCALAVFLLPAPPTPATADRDDAVLEAGFGEADITPTVTDKKPVYLAGFGNNRRATGVHDPLLARAVVLRQGDVKIALISVDVVGFFYPNVLRVRKQLPGFRYVLVSSTHNHEGPDTLGLWGPTALQSGVDADYLKTVEKQIVKAVSTAAAACQPVVAVHATARAPELLHDGREPYVLHDELTALEFRGKKDDKPVGLVVQWNCHPETLGSKNTEISADFVGYTVKYLQDKRRCPVVYLTGTVGGLMTSLKVDVKDAKGKELADGTYEKTERYGELVGELAERALKGAKPLALTPIEVRERTLFLPLENKLYQLGRKLGVFERQAYLWAGDPYKAEPYDGAEDKPLCVQTEVALLHFGDLEIAAIPGEIYPELVVDKVQDPVDPGADFPDAPIEPAIYKNMRGPKRMLIGLANDEIGYVIPKRQWDEKPPFCYGRKSAQYGEANSLGPDTAPLLCKAFKDAAARKK